MTNETGEKVRALRLKRGFTQQQLADAAGLNRLSVIYLESGKHKSTKSTTLVALAQALGSTLDALLSVPKRRPTARRAAGGGR